MLNGVGHDIVLIKTQWWESRRGEIIRSGGAGTVRVQ